MQSLKKISIIASFPAMVLIGRYFPFERIKGICSFYELTGYPCPGCGMTRAFIAITRLDLAQAFRMNALIFIVFAMFFLWWTISIYEMIAKRTTRAGEWIARNYTTVSLLIITLLVLFGIIRIVLLAFLNK